MTYELPLDKFWNDRKQKTKHIELNRSYFFEILEKLTRAFEYEDTPDGIDTTFLECYLLINGTVGISKSKKTPGEHVCYIGGYCGELNEYGIGDSYVGATTGESYNGKIGVDCVVGLNNSIRTGRLNLLDRYSGLLANIDESINIGIINSRMINPVECEDDKDIDQIKSINKQMQNGELTAVSSKRNSIFDDSKGRFSVLDIFKGDDVDKLQYYSRFYEDTLKRLWIESGIEISNKDKSAQVNTEELHEFAKYARITIEDMLECREQMCKDYNELFGGSWSVKLNHAFDNQTTKEDGDNVSRETSDEVKESEDEDNGARDD